RSPRARASRPRQPGPASTSEVRASLVLLEHAAEALVECLDLQALLIGQPRDRLGLLILETPGDVDDADVRPDDEVVELVSALGDHRRGEAAAHGLRLLHDGAELVGGAGELFLARL